MIPNRKHAAIPLIALACVAVIAFSVSTQLRGQVAASAPITAPAGWPINRALVVLDPAHGASDSGGVLADDAIEKDTTLAIVSRLRTALTGRGFSIITTRDTDVSDPLSNDQRAEIANRTHAMACLLIHATATGSGVHVYTSTLQASASDSNAETSHTYVPIPWETAQEPFVRQSLSLAGRLSASLGRAHLPTLVGQAPMRPLNNLMCPAVAVELAPLLAPGANATPATDANYQQQVANALAETLRAWRDSPELSPAARTGSEDGQTTAQGTATAAAGMTGRAAGKVRSSAHPAGPPAQKGPQ